MDRVDANLGLVHLVQRVLKGLDGALDVCLDDEVELLDLLIGHGREEVLQGDVLDLVLLLDAGLEGTLVGELARVTLVLKDTELVAGHRNALQSQDLDRVGGQCGCYVVAMGIHHGADLAEAHASHDGVAHMQGATGDQQGGNGTTATVELCLEDMAGGEGVGVGLELQHVSLQEDGLQELVDIQVLLGRDVDEHVLAAPLLGDDAVLGELLTDTVGIGAGLVDLVDGNDDGDVSGLGVVDGLDGLGHHAVVCGNDQDDDVRHLCATGTHGREGLVTRGIDEGDRAVVDRDLGCTDGLGDAAGLALCDARVTDGVQQGGLAVVDVAHDGNHGRPGLEVLGVIVEGEGVLLLLGHDLDVHAQVVSDQLDQVVGH